MSDRSARGDARCLEPTPLRVIPDAAFNAECPAHLLDDPVTPNDRFFVRNNGDLPVFTAREIDEWSIAIDGEVERPQRFPLKDLTTRFPAVSVLSVIECAGNGRSDFDPPTDGLQWSRGAVACVRWTGVRLGDVLRHCGVRSSAVYTGHHSRDTAVGGSKPAISRGLPVAKALADETLLAFAANGEEIAPLHGGPLRLVAPGFPGSAWQKWIERIELRDRVHDGAKMNGTDYRLPRRAVEPGETIPDDEFDIIESMPVNSVITHPADGSAFMRGREIDVRGFAWCGERPVAEVSVSIDGGRSWTRAALDPETERFAWRRFRCRMRADADEAEIVARAVDAGGRTQPLGAAAWNPRGYCNNGVHRIRLRAG